MTELNNPVQVRDIEPAKGARSSWNRCEAVDIQSPSWACRRNLMEYPKRCWTSHFQWVRVQHDKDRVEMLVFVILFANFIKVGILN